MKLPKFMTAWCAGMLLESDWKEKQLQVEELDFKLNFNPSLCEPVGHQN